LISSRINRRPRSTVLNRRQRRHRPPGRIAVRVGFISRLLLRNARIAGEHRYQPLHGPVVLHHRVHPVSGECTRTPESGQAHQKIAAVQLKVQIVAGADCEGVATVETKPHRIAAGHVQLNDSNAIGAPSGQRLTPAPSVLCGCRQFSDQCWIPAPREEETCTGARGANSPRDVVFGRLPRAQIRSRCSMVQGVLLRGDSGNSTPIQKRCHLPS
jgi:hypothetical protein